MFSKNVEARGADEIDLLSLFGVLYKYKLFVIIFTSICAFAAVGFSVVSLIFPADRSPLPNQYRAHALILIHEEAQGSISSMLESSGLGSLATLAGAPTGKSRKLASPVYLTWAGRL